MLKEDTAVAVSYTHLKRHAVDFIIEQVKKHPGEVTVASIGGKCLLRVGYIQCQGGSFLL